MLWIKEVEMVESVFCKRNSHAIFDMLDVMIASALNRIIHNTQFKRKVSLEEPKAHKEDRVLRGRDRLPDLRVLPGHWSQRFCR